ncbi:MAG: amidohydrolase family protein [Actinobacteria bacterium]|nr:amidohydrolase family protein [Actinomycetota bacterium]
MSSYDLHQHLWPESLVEALRARRDRPRLRGTMLELVDGDWEVDADAYGLEARLASLDRDEIDIAVVSCPPTLGLDEALLDAYHEGILELVGASAGRLRAFATDTVRDGFVGACVSAESLDDLAALAPLLDELERRDAVLFVHPGPAPGPDRAPVWWPAIVGYTAQMQSAYAAWLAREDGAWPTLGVVFAILAGGAPFQLERFASRGVDSRTIVDPNVYLDTASYGERALELSLATYGVGQLVYGSDLPVIDSGPTLRSVRGFGQAVADAVCRANPERLLA